MKRRELLLVGLLAALIGLALTRCAVKHPAIPKAVLHASLPVKDKEQLILLPHSLVIKTTTTTKSQYIPSSGKVVVDLQKNGDAVVHVKEYGLSLRPGLGVLYADTMRFSLDIQGAYYGRLGLHAGLGFYGHPTVLPFVALSYRLDQIHLPNTSMLFGHLLGNSAYCVGVRVEL